MDLSSDHWVEAVQNDHLSHPECNSKNVPQQSCMGFSYKGNGLISVAYRGGGGDYVRVRVKPG